MLQDKGYLSQHLRCQVLTLVTAGLMISLIYMLLLVDECCIYLCNSKIKYTMMASCDVSFSVGSIQMISLPT